MPELLEVETYRAQAEPIVGRRIVEAEAPDAWFVKGTVPEAVVAAVVGRRVEAVRRHGKLLVLDLDDGRRLGLRFGMTGRLLVDGDASIERLEYASPRSDPAWDRFRLRFDDGGDLRVRDPRRLGGVSLDPDEGRLGVDALALRPGSGDGRLAAALGASTAPLKARLLDQSRIAGIGNLLADEILWRAGLDPARPAGGLTPEEVDRLERAIAETLRELGARGGSHTGDLRLGATTDGLCPRDGTPLQRRRIGGRTTYSCPAHQR
ncbi:MAG TPA: DNA-formamidopyrimidine glycosylase family protein [Acidimicrobiales bacterium]